MSDFKRSKRSSSFAKEGSNFKPRRSFSSNSSDRPSYSEDRPISRDDNRSFREERSFGRSERSFSRDDRPSGGFSGGRRFGGGGGGFRGGRRGAPRGRSSSNDFSKYIKKAEPVAQETYQPVNTFQDFKINSALKQNVLKRGFQNPTPIQDQAIPLILEGRDVVGIANTGTGKTAAFLLPLIHKTLEARERGEFMASLVIVPTRELAMQIEEELRAFTPNMKIFSTSCVGGMDIRRQMKQLSKPNQFVIGTPGRLVDLTQRRVLNFNKFSNVVLDEADRMLDMGFIDDIKFLIEKFPTTRQSLFFSATLDPALQPLMNEFLTEPTTISVRRNHTSDNVDQDIVVVSRHQTKIDVLHDLLIQEDFTRVLIFGRTKHGVDGLAEELHSRGFTVEAIHGDRTQSRRQKALDKFKTGRVKILVATDVAARGLDINNVSHVINYDIPENYDDYVHRIGRTGRGNNTGKALTFVSK